MIFKYILDYFVGIKVFILYMNKLWERSLDGKVLWFVYENMLIGLMIIKIWLRFIDFNVFDYALSKYGYN